MIVLSRDVVQRRTVTSVVSRLSKISGGVAKGQGRGNNME